MIAIDTHTHSIASGHAYSTLEEMAHAARRKGLPAFALTDHSPGMPGSTHIYHFYNLRVLPREIHGVKVFHGVETNIIDFDGRIDLEDDILSTLEVVIASFHIPCLSPGTEEEHTQALLNAMKNPYVKIIGHPDDSRYPYDIPAVVKAAGETGTLLEMNNTSLSPRGFRVGARDNYIKILKECRRQGVMITIASDAHYSSRVGEVDYCEQMIRDIDFPRKLIANAELDGFLKTINLKHES